MNLGNNLNPDMEEPRAKAVSGDYVTPGINYGMPQQQFERNALYSSEGDDFISPALYE